MHVGIIILSKHAVMGRAAMRVFMCLGMSGTGQCRPREWGETVQLKIADRNAWVQGNYQLTVAKQR